MKVVHLSPVNFKALTLGLSLSLSVCQNFSAYASAEEGSRETNSKLDTLSFDVVFDQAVNATLASNKKGFTAHLKADLTVDGRVLAAADSLVRGHIEAIGSKGERLDQAACKTMHFAPSAPFKVVFDEIITLDNRSIKMHALPAKQCSMITEGGRLRSVEVTAAGIVRGPDRNGSLQLPRGAELLVTVRRAKSDIKPAYVAKASSESAKDSLVPALRASEAPLMVIKTVVNSRSQCTNESSESAEFESATKALAIDSTKNCALDPAKDSSKDSTENCIEDSRKASTQEPGETQTDFTSSAEDKVADEKSNNIPNNLKQSLAELGVSADGTMSKSFRVAFATQISSQASQANDQVLAVLQEDMKIGNKIIAKEGSSLFGHVVSIRESSRWGHAIKTNKGQKNAALRIQFDRLVTAQEKEYPIFGVTPAQATTFKNAGAFKTLSVSSEGEITRDEALNLSGQSDSAGILNVAALALMGPQAAVAMPLILIGALGKAAPGIANRVQKKTIGKGDELQIFPGDQISVQARFLDPAKEQLYVAGKVVHGKNLKTIRSASSHQSVE